MNNANVNNNNNNNNRNDNSDNTNSISSTESNSNPSATATVQVGLTAGGVGRRKRREAAVGESRLNVTFVNGTLVALVDDLPELHVRRSRVKFDEGFVTSAAAGIAFASNAWNLADRTDEVNCLEWNMCNLGWSSLHAGTGANFVGELVAKIMIFDVLSERFGTERLLSAFNIGLLGDDCDECFATCDERKWSKIVRSLKIGISESLQKQL